MLKILGDIGKAQAPLARRTLQLEVRGVDCGGCSQRLKGALEVLPGVGRVQVLLAAQRVVVEVSPAGATEREIAAAITRSGFTVRPGTGARGEESLRWTSARNLFALLATAVLLLLLAEWAGLIGTITDNVHWTLGALLVLLVGFGPLRKVGHDTLQARITAHSLVALGALAALLVGEWVTALVVVLFMKVAERIENFAASRGRRALRDLMALAPATALVERAGREVELTIPEICPGDLVVVRPGERIPVDGEVVAGHAMVDQAAITGEGLPVEVEPGSRVFAATIAHAGALRIRAERIGLDSTFGRVVQLVEQGELHRAGVQRTADRFATWYLPFVVLLGLSTWLIRGDVLAMAAVLVVACSCAFALATPVAMIASISAAAREGLLVKGGRYIEAVARADILLVDKTGTITLGQPRVTDVIPLGGTSEEDLLVFAAAAERDSEHPLGLAVRRAAADRSLRAPAPQQFTALPGLGVRALVDGARIEIGNSRLVPSESVASLLQGLHAEGKSTLLVARDGALIGVLAASDTVRPEVPRILAELRGLGFERIEILTGDNSRAAETLARSLGVSCRANLLPEDKIAIVEEYQARGHTVMMIGDGVNDAPALGRADAGVAMGGIGTDVALEAAHITLMRDDWTLLPFLVRVSRRTMGVVRLNLAYTVAYNVVGLLLAALGFLPPIVAAVAHSIPDVLILGNSSRLLRGGSRSAPEPAAECILSKGPSPSPQAALAG
jgi:P-type Cu+ transporter